MFARVNGNFHTKFSRDGNINNYFKGAGDYGKIENHCLKRTKLFNKNLFLEFILTTSSIYFIKCNSNVLFMCRFNSNIITVNWFFGIEKRLPLQKGLTSTAVDTLGQIVTTSFYHQNSAKFYKNSLTHRFLLFLIEITFKILWYFDISWKL